MKPCRYCGRPTTQDVCFACSGEEKSAVPNLERRSKLSSIESLNDQAKGVFLMSLAGILFIGPGAFAVFQAALLNKDLVELGGRPNLLATVAIFIGLFTTLLWLVFFTLVWF